MKKRLRKLKNSPKVIQLASKRTETGGNPRPCIFHYSLLYKEEEGEWIERKKEGKKRKKHSQQLCYYTPLGLGSQRQTQAGHGIIPEGASQRKTESLF